MNPLDHPFVLLFVACLLVVAFIQGMQHERRRWTGRRFRLPGNGKRRVRLELFIPSNRPSIYTDVQLR